MSADAGAAAADAGLRILRSAAVDVASLALVVPRGEIQRVMGPGIGEVLKAIADQGQAPSGPWFTHHRRRPTETFDFAICVPVQRPLAAVGRVRPGHLPAATVARTVHRGPYEGLAAAWGALHAWIAAQGRSPHPDLWECYVRGPESSTDPSSWLTELNQPLHDAAA